MVDPGVPPARVIAMIEDEMRELAIPNVARTPAPSCILHGFEHGNLRYSLRYHLTDFLEDDTTDSMVRVHLFATLQRAGIRIAEPQHTVHAIQRDEAHAATVRKRELSRRMQALTTIPFLAKLPEAERAELAERHHAGATPFLKLAGIVAGGWQMARAALISDRKVAEGSGDVSFFKTKIATARFYGDHVLVQAPGLRDTVVKGSAGVMALGEDQFLAA